MGCVSGVRGLRRSVALALAAILSCLVAACGASPSNEEGLGTLRVVTSVPHSLLFIGVQAAERLGTWDGTDLTVEHIKGSSATAGKVMVSGEAEIGLTDGIRAMANIVQGLPATLVGSCYSPWTQLIIAGSHTGAENIEDLKGANFGISGKGSAGHYSTVKLAESLGWSKNDYTVTPLGNVNALTAPLQSGAIDAFAWSPDTAFDLERRGIGKVLAPTDKSVGPNVFEIFSVMNETLKQRPKAVKVFFDGYYDAIKRLQKNPQLAVDILVQDWDLNPIAAQRAVELELPQLSTDGVISPEQFMGLADAAGFATGTVVDDPKASYTYWQDIKR